MSSIEDASNLLGELIELERALCKEKFSNCLSGCTADGREEFCEESKEYISHIDRIMDEYVPPRASIEEVGGDLLVTLLDESLEHAHEACIRLASGSPYTRDSAGLWIKRSKGLRELAKELGFYPGVSIGVPFIVAPAVEAPSDRIKDWVKKSRTQKI